VGRDAEWPQAGQGVKAVKAWHEMRNPWDQPRIKAETAEEIEEIQTGHGLRKRIFEASRHDPLVRRVMDLAMLEGLNTEEMFTRLAYYALVAKDDAEARLLECLQTSVPIVRLPTAAAIPATSRLDAIALEVIQAAPFSNHPIEVDSSQYHIIVDALKSAYREGIKDSTQRKMEVRDQA
jgi:hypothetical protein